MPPGAAPPYDAVMCMWQRLPMCMWQVPSTYGGAARLRAVQQMWGRVGYGVITGGGDRWSHAASDLPNTELALSGTRLHSNTPLRRCQHASLARARHRRQRYGGRGVPSGARQAGSRARPSRPWSRHISAFQTSISAYLRSSPHISADLRLREVHLRVLLHELFEHVLLPLLVRRR